MSRKLSWGVAVGATLLISLTGCSSQQVGQAGAAGPNDVCGLLAAPVTAQLVANGITATPVTGGTGGACRWQDQASSTTVTLTALDKPATPPVGRSTTGIPGVGEVADLGPGELGFSAGGRSWDLKVESKSPAEVNTQTATDLVTTVGTALGGATTGTTTAPSSAGAGTQQKDSTVTVTDSDGRTTDLRSSNIQVANPDGIDLGNGQTVPLDKISKVEFSDSGDVTTVAVRVTLLDSTAVDGKIFPYLAVEGESDFGAFRQLVKELKTVEFRRDTPFVATAEPQLAPFSSATATVVETTGKSSTVPAQSLRFISDPAVTLSNGQTVLFEKITKIDAKATVSGGVELTLTLVTGQEVSGTIDPHIPISGDTDNGALATTPDALTSITFDRGAASS